MTERDIFLSAMEIEDTAERAAHLKDACGGDAELQARVEALLASHESRSRFLNTPVMDQMSGDPTWADDATQLSDSTRDADASLEYNGPDTLIEECDDMFDEIPLGYLAPSSKKGSLGQLAHYEIEEVLGRGAFGTVLKAFDEKLHRVVAIKVLAPEMAATSPARKRFLREARSSAQIRHEHVVAIYGVEEEPIPYLVMEYIPGQTLQQRLDEHGPLDVKDVVRLGKQMADGLAAAHAEGLIHRDIKPGNILLDTSVADRVKITDFGLARTADDASMTQSGLIAGTPMYMAPEQAHGKKLDQRADLFSFGSVLYQMLSGRPPFRAPSTMAVLKRVTEDMPRPIREVIPEVPVWMCEIVGHLHAKDPDQRYGSAKEVSELLAKCLADVEAGRKPKIPAPAKTAEEPPALVRPTESRRALHRPLAKIAAAIVLLVIGLGITEATDLTDFSATVIRLVTGSGTLVIQINDPDVQVAIDGEEVTVRGAGVEELTLRAGEYNVTALKDGEPVSQELVTITRNERTVVRIRMEPVSPESGVGVVSESQFPPAAPFTDADVSRIADLSAEKQIEEVRRELIRRNPGFDGQLIPTIEDDKVTGLEFRAYHVSDISPVRALVHLERLVAKGDTEKGLLSDLSPLQGMQLTYLNVNYNDKLQSLDPLRGMPLKILWCYECPISDLSPLQGTPLEELHLWFWIGADLTPLMGMPLKRLNVGGNSRVQDLSALADLPLEYLCINQTQVSDLTPLQGLPLEHLSATATHVSDLSPLRGKKLTRLTCDNSNVSDLSVLQGMPLKEIRCDFQPTRDTEILRSIETLETINDKPAAEFWQDVDAGLSSETPSEDDAPVDGPAPPATDDDSHDARPDDEDAQASTPPLPDNESIGVTGAEAGQPQEETGGTK